MTLDNDKNQHNPWRNGQDAQGHSLAELKTLLQGVDLETRELMETAYLLGAKAAEKPKQEIIVLVHGIRTHAEWQERLRDILERRSIKSVPIGYGFFDVLRFLCPIGTRGGPQNRLERELRSIKSEHPNADISVVAHSFGTYLIAKILDDATDISLHRLVLCGSIIREAFRWDKVRSRVRLVVNDVGCRDIWPILAKQVSIGYGTSGVFGFKTAYVHDRFHACGHSDFFQDSYMEKYWLPFLEDGQIVGSSEDRKRKSSWTLSFMAWLPVKPIIFALALIVFVPFGWAKALLN